MDSAGRKTDSTCRRFIAGQSAIDSGGGSSWKDMAMIVGMTRSARAALLSALGAVALIGSGAAPAQV